MIALLVFITLTLAMVAPLLLLKPSPLTEREVARINECNAWVAETKAKLDATQAKADALTAKAAVPAVPAVHYTVSSTFFTDVPYTAIEWVAIEGEELRLEHPAYSEPEWVWHTVTRGWFYRVIGPRRMREAAVVAHYPEADVHAALDDEIDWGRATVAAYYPEADVLAALDDEIDWEF